MKQSYLAAIAGLILGAACVSCSSDDDPLELHYLRFSAFNDFNEESVWKDCYDINTGAVTVDDFSFSHSADASEWDGVVYKSWKGFCPSRVFDTQDFSTVNWMDHQWAAMMSADWQKTHPAYIVLNWDVTEPVHPQTLTGNESCVIRRSDGAAFMPLSLYVSNTSYAYYTMLNGNAFSQPFTADSWLKIIFTGMMGGQSTGSKEVYLAKDNVYITNFMEVDMAEVGLEVDAIVVTFEGSDTGQWGLNTPAYAAIGAFTWANNKK